MTHSEALWSCEGTHRTEQAGFHRVRVQEVWARCRYLSSEFFSQSLPTPALRALATAFPTEHSGPDPRLASPLSPTTPSSCSSCRASGAPDPCYGLKPLLTCVANADIHAALNSRSWQREANQSSSVCCLSPCSVCLDSRNFRVTPFALDKTAGPGGLLA